MGGGGGRRKILDNKKKRKKKKKKEKNFPSYWFRLKTLYPSYVLLKEANLVSKSISLHNKPPWFASSLTKASPQYYFTSLYRGKQREIEARNWLQSDWVCIHSDNYSSDVINLIFSQNGFRSIVPRTKELNSLKIYANFHQNRSLREGKTGVVSIIS